MLLLGLMIFVMSFFGVLTIMNITTMNSRGRTNKRCLINSPVFYNIINFKLQSNNLSEKKIKIEMQCLHCITYTS